MRPVIIFAFFVLFMLAMDLYALRGIQYLFSPGRNINPSFQYIYWGISVLMFAALIFAGTRFQQLRDPSRFFGIMLIMILYHIPLFVKGRENSYLYYILYILAFLVFFINKEGYIYELIPRFTTAPITFFLGEIFLLFFLLFHFLQILYYCNQQMKILELSA